MIETLSRKRLKQIENIFAKWREDGTSFNFDDVYFIYYAPITTKSGEAKGIDKNGYLLSAYKDADKNGSLNIFIGIKIIDGTLVLLPGSDEQIPELSFTSS